MRKVLVASFAVVLASAAIAFAQEWSNVPLVDQMCLAKVKAAPDSHPRACLLQCAKSGYVVLTSDGTALKLDEAGNAKAVAALRASGKSDHIRVNVKGERDGDTIHVESITLE